MELITLSHQYYYQRILLFRLHRSIIGGSQEHAVNLWVIVCSVKDCKTEKSIVLWEDLAEKICSRCYIHLMPRDAMVDRGAGQYQSWNKL